MKMLGGSFGRHAVAAAVCVALGSVAQAQSSNATLRGAVTGTGATAANAEITATNVNTGVVQRTRAGADGAYVLTGLAPGTYKIVVAGADGKRTERIVTLQVGQAASLDLALGEPSPQAPEQIIITGTALVDKKTSEVGTYVTPQQIQRLPQVTRNFLSFADLAPGANVEYDSEGNVSLRSGASAKSAVNVFIDGVSQKDYVLRGGATGQDNSRGNPFPQSAIAEYKIITQNYKAEFDQVSSAAITALTKSGTNEFHGDAFYDHTAQNLRSATPAEEKAGKKTESSQDQYGVSVGGPIIRDQLHYFLALEAKRNKDPRTVTAGGGPGIVALLPASVQSLQGPVSAPFTENLLFGKLSWNPNESHRVELSAKVRRETDLKHIGGQESSEFSSNNKIDDTRVVLKHQYTTDRITNEALLSYEDAFFAQDPVSFANGARYRFIVNGNDNNGVIEAGGNNFYQRKGQKGYSLQDDLTATGLNWNGSHVFKLGVKAKWITVDAIEQANPVPQFYYDLTGSNPTQPYKVEFGSALNGIGNGALKTKNSQLGIYVQDDWEVNRRLTLNLGLRWDYERSPAYLNHVTPADVVAALNRPEPGDRHAPAGQTYAQSLALGGVNLADYVSTGSNRKPFKNAFQPRLGFSFDLAGDKRHVAFGGAGRSYDRNVFDVLQLERTKGTFPSSTIAFQGSNWDQCRQPYPANCVPWNPQYLQAGGLSGFSAAGSGREVDLLNNKLKTPYSDQFTLGLRSTLGAWETEVSLSHIEQKDGITWLLGNRRPNGDFYEPGKHWGSPWGNGIPGLGSLLIGTNGLRSTTDSVQLRADKPYTKASGWGVTTSYAYSDSKENHNFADAFSYTLDYPTVAMVPLLRSSVVPRHKLVSTGTYDLPWGVLISGKLTLATPKYLFGINCERECHADTAKGKSYRQVDLSMSKGFNVGAGVQLNLRADVINLFDYRNPGGYDVKWGAPGQPNVATPNNDLAGPTRTIKIGLGATW